MRQLVTYILSFIKTLRSVIKTILFFFIILQIAGIAWLGYLAKPFVLKLQKDHIIIRQRINFKLDHKIPINTAINTKLDIPIKEKISLSLPIKGVFDVNIDEPFEIPVIGPIHVAMDHGFHIQKEIPVNSEIAINQTVKTRLMGFDTEIPIKGTIPINLNIPVDEKIQLTEQFSLTATKPLNCQITKDFHIPIDLVAKTQFAIDENIPVPINAQISTGIHLKGELPCYLYIDIYLDKKRGLVVDHVIQVK